MPLTKHNSLYWAAVTCLLPWTTNPSLKYLVNAPLRRLPLLGSSTSRRNHWDTDSEWCTSLVCSTKLLLPFPSTLVGLQSLPWYCCHQQPSSTTSALHTPQPPQAPCRKQLPHHWWPAVICPPYALSTMAIIEEWVKLAASNKDLPADLYCWSWLP